MIKKPLKIFNFDSFLTFSEFYSLKTSILGLFCRLFLKIQFRFTHDFWSFLPYVSRGKTIAAVMEVVITTIQKIILKKWKGEKKFVLSCIQKQTLASCSFVAGPTTHSTSVTRRKFSSRYPIDFLTVNRISSYSLWIYENL